MGAWALVLNIAGTCLCVPTLVGVPLAILSLVRSRTNEAYRDRVLPVIALLIPLASLPIYGLLAAVAIPNFIRFQARSHQRECRDALQQAYALQQSHLEERRGYSEKPAEVGFNMPRGNRYAYYFSSVGTVAANTGSPGADDIGIGVDEKYASGPGGADPRVVLHPTVSSLAGMYGACPGSNCGTTMLCVANIDSDDAMDVWIVSTRALETTDGQAVLPGVPFNLHNDVEDTRLSNQAATIAWPDVDELDDDSHGEDSGTDGDEEQLDEPAMPGEDDAVDAHPDDEPTTL